MHHRLLFASALLLCAALAAGTERTVYRSVDARGNVSFSDRPPPGGAAETLRVEADDPVPSPEVAERREAMRRVADELEAERRARETGMAAPRDAAVAPPAAAQPPEPSAAGQQDWLPVYYPYPPYRPPSRPPYARPWPPPAQPAPIPRPNPDSLSPRGLEERLRQAR